ncbi:alpha/beta hydrolase [Sneathiella marina]|uniref:Alpha/beta hydrolase n=1 Tax=Sneathiella marina TaxID=2950108 RepID=A0ABY4W267_9PROT|nr:alpha/beta hydrolase [Sneathiella marina]USG61260.1 alpha/beta hydrolase [Sneathiella marina]
MTNRLEAEFVFRDRYPERSEIYERFDTESATLRAAGAAQLDRPYGAHPRARFDLFPGQSGKGLVVFVHGGYWQSHNKERYSFVAAPFLRDGSSVALVGYPLAPEVGIATMIIHIGAAIAAIFDALHRSGIAPSGWVLTGHSAGGHLAASAAPALPASVMPLSGLVPISGLFDLSPLLGTSVNHLLKMDTDMAKSASPLEYPAAETQLIAIVGSAETKEYLRQSSAMVDKYQAADRHGSALVTLPGENHYSILLELLQPRSIISGIVSKVLSGACEKVNNA